MKSGFKTAQVGNLEKGHCLHVGSASMTTIDKAIFLKWLKDPDIKQALQNKNKSGIDLIQTYTKKINERFHKINEKESITDLLKTENKELKNENQRLKAENEELKRRLAENITSLTPTCTSTPVTIPTKKRSNQMMPSSLNCDTSEDKDHPFKLRFSGIPEADPDAQVVNTKEQVVDFLKTCLKVSVKPTEITSA